MFTAVNKAARKEALAFVAALSNADAVPPGLKQDAGIVCNVLQAENAPLAAVNDALVAFANGKTSEGTHDCEFNFVVTE